MSEALAAKREARIMERCQRLAHQIAAELESSYEDHFEDDEQLEGLMEVWEALRLSHQYDADLIEYHEQRERTSGQVREDK